jgi:hypothetical protein
MNPQVQPQEIAKIAHETLRYYGIATEGDLNQPAFEELSSGKKQQLTNTVLFYLKNPQATVAEGHAMWLAWKEKEGYHVGTVRNVARKESPNLVTFAALPPDQRAKSFIIRGVVEGFRSFIEPSELQSIQQQERERVVS